MNNQSTDKLSIDANQDKPRIIFRDTVTITTSTNDYAPIVYGQSVIALSNLRADVNTIIEVYMKDNQTLSVHNIPFVTGNSSGQFAMNAYFGLYGETIDGKELQRMSITISKRNGSLSDTYTFFVIIYSTQLTDKIIQSS